MIAAIRIKGRVEVPREIKDTLYLLKLRQKYACSLFQDKKEIKGMLEKVKFYVSYGEINDNTLKELLEKRGRKIGDKKLDSKEVDKIIEELKKGKSLSEISKEIGIKPFFRLNNPKGGFKKSTKLLWPQGILGNIGDKINDLILRML